MFEGGNVLPASWRNLEERLPKGGAFQRVTATEGKVHIPGPSDKRKGIPYAERIYVHAGPRWISEDFRIEIEDWTWKDNKY